MAITGRPLRRAQVTWLVARAGLGGWALVVLLGGLNPFEGDLFFRWLILGASWLAAVFSRHAALAPAADSGDGSGRGRAGRR